MDFITHSSLKEAAERTTDNGDNKSYILFIVFFALAFIML